MNSQIRMIRVISLLLGVGFMVGCSGNKLETGYNYTPLGDSPIKRRGYYADPFSPEARAAQQARQSEFEGRRPVPGE